jgi:hypothetical protein
MLSNDFHINIFLPNFYEFSFLNLVFVTLQKNRPEVFNDNYKIVGADGCFPYSIWSTVRDEKYVPKYEMENILLDYKSFGIKINYLFDNVLISEKDLDDTFSNLLLKLANYGGNGIYVKSEILYDYIKNTYPNYNLIKIADVNQFDLENIFIDERYNDCLSSVEHKESAYVTLNPFCPKDCELYNNHHLYVANEQYNFYSLMDSYICPKKKLCTFYDLKDNNGFISNTKIIDYVKLGFHNFRINFPFITKCIDIGYTIFDVCDSYVFYLIKPKYQNDVRYRIINKILENKNEQRV